MDAVVDTAFERRRIVAFGLIVWGAGTALAAMRERKKFWLLPIILVLLLVGGLLVLTQGSVIAPFIYTLF